MILSIEKLTPEQITRLKMALNDPILIELLERERQYHMEVALETDVDNIHDPSKQNLLMQNQTRYKEWNALVKFLSEVNAVSMEELYAMTTSTED